MTNMIPPMMTPYLYAVGATVAALLTPLMLRFILAAAKDTVAHNTETMTTPPAAETEQKWLLPCLFAIMVISSAIACHHHQYWTQIILNLAFTWLVIAEIFLESRLQITIDPIVALGLGLGLLASIDMHSELGPQQAILGACAGWLTASLLHLAHTLLKSKNNLPRFFHPALLAWLGAWLGPIALLVVFIISMSLNGLFLILVQTLQAIIIKLKSKGYFNIESISVPFNVWLIVTTWIFKYFFLQASL